MDSLLQKANEIKDEIIAIRRDIHAHPELGHKEVRTEIDALPAQIFSPASGRKIPTLPSIMV